ncbi:MULTISPECIES: Rieske (2Fe-2S) protein [Streptomyces]|uniref:Cytochrome bc1 complex Rieske iron-sulfur subunit n=1 Tax=Streptomyces solicathayae TaxID=3081768 RepID=A0ABZ0M1H7_9ACTN|nr:Rieske (2Fe-2S) protein [Streptomyces sp. HUAS YS2]WOX25630.1 Rieske (2Fe-2S) protein [Streptomyces sp. HUAS YS2]
MSAVARRTVVAAAGGAGLIGVLAGCGSTGDAGADSPGAGGTGGSASGGGTASGGGAGSGAVLAKTGDIPQGGGKVFADRGVVVTQPTAGEFKAFSSSCTHSGCAVKDVTDGTITCPCHGSAFSAADGSVKQGPATRPLPPAAIKVDGDSITLA